MQTDHGAVKAISYIHDAASIAAFVGPDIADGVEKVTLIDSGSGLGWFLTYPAWQVTVAGKTINHGKTFGYFADGAWRLTLNESFAFDRAARFPQVSGLNR